MGDQRLEELAAMAISPDGKSLYLQFKENCNSKDDMSRRLIEFWRAEGIELPKFAPMKEPIFPSTKTIDVTGAYWRED